MKDTFTETPMLIESLKKGDSKAYTFLVDTYYNKLCVYAFGLTHDKDSAEDIVQNVLIRFWKKREKLKPDFSITSFLYKSVYNEFIDQYRKQKPVFPLEKKHIDALTTVTEDEDKQTLEQMIHLLKQEIQNLPPKCKEIFILSKQEGLTNIEIAEYKNVSVKAVEFHITKGFSILRESLIAKNLWVYLFVFRLIISNI
jgi:RNA polymerase sigma-70 factor (family 1)